MGGAGRKACPAAIPGPGARRAAVRRRTGGGAPASTVGGGAGRYNGRVDSIRCSGEPAPGVVEEATADPRASLARPWKVVVHDDPITLMVYVTMVLRKLFGYPQAEAHRLMMEVHTTGAAVVWSGAREQAEMYVFKLHAHQLLATAEPGDSE